MLFKSVLNLPRLNRPLWDVDCEEPNAGNDKAFPGFDSLTINPFIRSDGIESVNNLSNGFRLNLSRNNEFWGTNGIPRNKKV